MPTPQNDFLLELRALTKRLATLISWFDARQNTVGAPLPATLLCKIDVVRDNPALHVLYSQIGSINLMDVRNGYFIYGAHLLDKSPTEFTHVRQMPGWSPHEECCIIGTDGGGNPLVLRRSDQQFYILAHAGVEGRSTDSERQVLLGNAIELLTWICADLQAECENTPGHIYIDSKLWN